MVSGAERWQCTSEQFSCYDRNEEFAKRFSGEDLCAFRIGLTDLSWVTRSSLGK
jgi:hypothetical protein